MAISMHGRDGRLPLLNPALLKGAQRALYDDMCGTIVPLASAGGFESQDDQGHLIGPLNPALFSPKLSGNFLALQQVEEKYASLTPRARQIVILSVGSVWLASYELYAHSALAATIGLSPEQIEALSAGLTTAGLPNNELAVQRFTLQLVRQHSVVGEVYAAAQVAVGDTGLVEMVVLIGCYLTVCAQQNAFAIPVPGKGELAEAKGAT